VPRRWVTVDWADADFEVDLRRDGSLPFPDDSFDSVYSAHTIEHLDERSLMSLMREARRVLRPGGRLRIETPDAERVVSAYGEGDESFLSYFVEENRRNLGPEYAEPHIAVLGLLSCYIEQDGPHVAVRAPREDFERHLAEDDLDDLGRWAVSLQTPEQYRSGGHVACLYSGKLERMLREAGFRSVERSAHGESALPLDGLERGERAFYSVYVEAVA